MHKTAKRTRSQYDLNGDIEKIKALLAETALDVKGRAGEMLSQSLENAKERTTSLKDNVEEYTHERPFKSLGLSFVTGLVVGYLFKRH